MANNGKLYEYAALYHPLQTKEQHELGEQPKAELIVEVTQVVASSEKEALMVATRAVPEKYTDKLDCVEIAIRPF